MKILETRSALREWRKSLTEKKIGFVPTMGALHAGHKSLLDQARRENDVVILSVFVNPIQFNSADDFKNYPKTWESDLAIAKSSKIDAVFAPLASEMFGENSRFRVTESEFSKKLCGAFRPGHFDGVLTVVMKLFQLVEPTHAYFGEKDRQQLHLIEDMVKEFFLDMSVVACPTVRESDGLAMSSRNLRLSPGERSQAPALHRAIIAEKSSDDARRTLEKNGFRVEYVEDLEGYRYAAAWLGNVRLIDNVAL